MKNSIIFFIFLSFFTNNLFADKDENRLLQKYQSINMEEYSIKNMRKKVKKTLYGNGVDLISVQKLSIIPTKNIYKYKDIWLKKGILWPDVIVLSNGVYDLKMVHSLINDEKIIRKIKKNSYLLKRPIYVAPTATLVINASTLKLSLAHGSFIIYHGNLDVIDSFITSWDIRKGNYGSRKLMDKLEMLMHTKSTPRPFILGLEGSYTNMINSDFIGLGFKGTPGMYGISILKRETKPILKGSLSSLFRNRQEPSGVLIGNNISKCFFGFYSKNVKDVFLIGNLFYDNIIYGIDPHNYSKNLIVARNITHSTKYAHGIIFSREVGESIIAENITFLNSGSGITLDRNCENTLIYKNTSFENKVNGISVLESDHNVVMENRVLRNYHNGIFVRNSLDIDLRYNYIYHNALNGTEIATANIDKFETRNFKLDPYHKSAKVSLVKNYFEKNINSALALKEGAGLFFQHNIFHNSAPLYFSGEIEKYTENILNSNRKNGFLFENGKVLNP